jgi:flagellar basal-body rod protein FlgB
MVDPISMSETLQVLRKSLDSLAVRHDAIATNLANIDTPQFKRLEVTFQEKLQAAVDKAHYVSPLMRTHPKHYPIQSPVDLMNFQPDVRTVTETSGRNDGNNVDIDMESAKLAENTAHYNAVADVTSRYLTSLRRAITGGTQ